MKSLVESYLRSDRFSGGDSIQNADVVEETDFSICGDVGSSLILKPAL